MTASRSTATRSTARARRDSTLNPAGFGNSTANLPIGGASAATAVADFNRDGNSDLVVTVANTAISNNVLVFLGSGNGSFSSSLTLANSELNPLAVITGDFNQDGNADIVTANSGSDTVSLLLGNGVGGFQAAQAFRVGDQPNALATGDFNKDGRLDLVAANAGLGANTLSVLLSDSGGFSSAKNIRVEGTQPFAVATGDFDRDGDLDLISADSTSRSLSLLLGNGNGTFQNPKQFFVGGAVPVALVTGDFDGDNKLDVATGNFAGNSSNLSILLGDGRGDFPTAKAVSTGSDINSLVTGDFNGDGDLDLAATLSNSSTLALLLGDGDGNFTRSNDVAVNGSPSGLSVADFNQDGKPDLVSASGSANDASIVLNKTSAVLLRSSRNLAEVDGSAETEAAINANLDRGTLVIDGSPTVRLSVRGFKNVLGTQVKDTIIGSDARNLLDGNNGQDRLTGLDGNDQITGGEGRDRLTGGAGNDRLTGGTGRDWLKGNQGRDRFIFDHSAAFNLLDDQDRISDFEKGQDKIVLDRGTFTAIGNVSFESVNTVAEAGTSAAAITYLRSTGRLYYNADGTTAGFGTGGLFATLDQSKSANGNLTASDFLTQQ